MDNHQFNIEKVIREYITQIIHMPLATCVDNKPWVCEVHFSYDDDLNLYFRSTTERRHSKEISKNSYVSGNIITQHFLNQKVRGVYFEGHAEQLKDVNERHPAFVAYNKRFNIGPQVVQATHTKSEAHFYKIIVSDFYVLDGYSSDQPHKYHLPWGDKKV